ncbi:hypothetical protein L486_05856 [Kwoniella mangroviensis CBS 10435]|uniref:Uncharacterized protein n=1 Tax=Kwoniella mangroviensis CBS 10435 TaxID=1331196 RepID=A0A1B9IN42_9TREE|nr:hypothetical protein L486_05856 [Kwoniella mangroviensis CBS 10435]
MSNNGTTQNQSTLPFTDHSQHSRPLRRYRTGPDVREKRDAMDAAAREISEGWRRAESDHNNHWSEMDDQTSAPEIQKPTTSKQSSDMSTNASEVFDNFDEKTKSQQTTSMMSSPTTTSWKNKISAKISDWSTSIGGKR